MEGGEGGRVSSALARSGMALAFLFHARRAPAKQLHGYVHFHLTYTRAYLKRLADMQLTAV